MSIIVSNCQHCDEQQFRALSCVHYTIFSAVNSDFIIRALLLDRIHITEKATRASCVHLVYVIHQKHYTYTVRKLTYNIMIQNT